MSTNSIYFCGQVKEYFRATSSFLELWALTNKPVVLFQVMRSAVINCTITSTLHWASD